MYMSSIVHIKNMVCPRCVSVVRLEANQLGLPLASVQLGEVVFESELSKPQFDAFINALASHGFEVLDDRIPGLADVNVVADDLEPRTNLE